MSQNINYHEYERRKAKIQNIGLDCEQYEAAISRIVKALEADAGRAEIHEAKTTDAACPTCRAKGTLEPEAGYFDPRLVGVSKDDPRKYEEGWKCHECWSNFASEDIEKIAA